MITRRTAVLNAAATTASLWALRRPCRAEAAKPAETFEIAHTPAEWRRLLTPEQYYVLRLHGTERPFTSPLNDEKRAGTYHCAACDLPLFSSKAKFDSHTGWPSFLQPLEDAVGTSEDRTLWLMVRTEVHCRRCGSHLGHVFDDGPAPTHMRYCMNGAAMAFKPGNAA